MEGAVRIFAGEFNQSSLTLPDGEGKDDAWVVTPSGAYCREVFLAGAFLEIREEGGMLHARLADPTGGFDLVCGGERSPAAAGARTLPIPSFVSVSGRARLFSARERNIVSVRADRIQLIDRAVRDQWMITTARVTLARLAAMHAALAGTCTDGRVLRAFSHYSPAAADLDRIAEMVADALESVGIQPASPAVTADPRQLIREFLRSAGGQRGVSVEAIIEMALAKSFSRESALATIESLVMEDECYQPQKGYIKLL